MAARNSCLEGFQARTAPSFYFKLVLLFWGIGYDWLWLVGFSVELPPDYGNVLEGTEIVVHELLKHLGLDLFPDFCNVVILIVFFHFRLEEVERMLRLVRKLEV
mgnify:CR=1 FL=1